MLMNNITNEVYIASHNPVKINATSIGFGKMLSNEQYAFDGISTDSGVPDQPIGSDQTFLGAKNRALSAQAQRPDAAYCVGIEGGIETTDRGTEVFAWVYIIDKAGRVGLGKSSGFYLPKSITDLLQEGMELGHATDKIFDESNSKQNSGSIGILTGDLIDRTQYYVEAVVLALIPFRNEDLYFEETTSAPKP